MDNLKKKYFVIIDNYLTFDYIYSIQVTKFKTKNKNQTIMKQIVALFTIVALASCGNGTSTEVKTTASTAVAVDSTMVTDSAKVVVDSTKVVVDTAKVGTK